MQKFTKNLCALFVTLTAMLCISTITSFAGNSFSSAQTIKAETAYTCTILNGGEEQYFSFTPSVTADYTFYSTGNYDTYVTLYDSRHNEIDYSDDGADASNFSLRYRLIKGETYYYAAKFYSSSYTGSFGVYLQSHQPASISNAKVTLSKTSYTYDDKAKEPSATVTLNGKTLINSIDYTIAYRNNKNKGTATATIKGIGDYTGSVNKTFKIKAKKIKSFKFYHGTYNGKTQTPALYYNKKVYNAEYDYTYTKECKYKSSADYTIKVSGGHKNVGEYKFTVKFKGNYTGTVKKTFKIFPKPVKSISTSKASTTTINAKWKKIDNVSGYRIYVYNNKKGKFVLYKTTGKTNITIKRPCSEDTTVSFYIRTYKKVGKKTYLSKDSCYDYDYLKPTAPTITIKNTNFSEFTVNFKKIDSYQLQVSTNRNFKNKTYYDYAKTYRYSYTDSARFNNCESEKRYYVRARRYYYNKKGELKVSPWSKVKSVKPY